MLAGTLQQECAAYSTKKGKINPNPTHWIPLWRCWGAAEGKLGSAGTNGQSPAAANRPKLSWQVFGVAFVSSKLKKFQPKWEKNTICNKALADLQLGDGTQSHPWESTHLMKEKSVLPRDYCWFCLSFSAFVCKKMSCVPKVLRWFPLPFQSHVFTKPSLFVNTGWKHFALFFLSVSTSQFSLFLSSLPPSIQNYLQKTLLASNLSRLVYRSI